MGIKLFYLPDHDVNGQNVTPRAFLAHFFKAAFVGCQIFVFCIELGKAGGFKHNKAKRAHVLIHGAITDLLGFVVLVVGNFKKPISEQNIALLGKNDILRRKRSMRKPF